VELAVTLALVAAQRANALHVAHHQRFGAREAGLVDAERLEQMRQFIRRMRSPADQRVQLAGRHPVVGAEMGKYGWLGLVSQGGMALTLAAVLRSAFPEWNVSLEALLVAMIGFHEVAGPICFQWALRRTGEVTERREERDVPETALVVDGDNLVSRV
jgi:hypothetical protein